MPDMGAGVLLYHVERNTAKLQFTPNGNVAAYIRDIHLNISSPNDVWVCSVNGQEVARYRVTADINQNVLPPASPSVEGYKLGFFNFCRDELGIDPSIYVDRNQTFTMESEGGQTADIYLEYEETNPQVVGVTLANSYGARRFIAPVWGLLSNNVSAIGEAPFTSEVGLSFVPPVFLDDIWPTGWTARVLALFLEARSYNAYASSTDHISHTEYLALRESGQSYFTRADMGGIPLIGESVGPGAISENNDTALTPYPSFQNFFGTYNVLPAPLMLRPGSNIRFRVGISGDVGAGTDYSPVSQLAIVEYVEQ